MEKKLNSTEIFYCRHMDAGLVGYENEDVFVDNETLKKICNTMVGKPLYVEHQQFTNNEGIIQADGWVVDCFYNQLDGCLWAKFIAVSEDAKQKIKEGWSVSNAYYVKDWGGAGVYNNKEYNKEVLDAEFDHLALVPNPRYNKAKIFTMDEYKQYKAEKKAELDSLQLTNSKSAKLSTINNGVKTMFKLFKNTKEEVSTIDAETMIELKNSKGEVEEVSLQSMINALLNEKEKEKEKEMLNMDSEVEVGDEKMSIKDLINKYNNLCKNKKKNEEDKEEDEKENEEEEKIKEDEKKNSVHFNSLMNAKPTQSPLVKYETMTSQLARGSELYGSKKNK